MYCDRLYAMTVHVFIFWRGAGALTYGGVTHGAAPTDSSVRLLPADQSQRQGPRSQSVRRVVEHSVEKQVGSQEQLLTQLENIHVESVESRDTFRSHWTDVWPRSFCLSIFQTDI